MLQHYEVRGICDVIHDVTTVIWVIAQDNSVTYHHVHSRPGARAVRSGGHENFLGGQENFFWGARKIFWEGKHFVNSIDKSFIKNNNYSTVRLLEARSLDLSCCFIEERLW